MPQKAINRAQKWKYGCVYVWQFKKEEKETGEGKTSWVDKAHKKNKVHNLVEQAMKDPRFQVAQKKQMEEATSKAFDSFLLISADYMHRHEGYSKKRLLKFINFVVEQMGFVAEDEEYFKALNAELFDETGVDILNNCVRK